MIFLKLLSIVAVNLLVYWQTINFHYVCDDLTLYTQTNPKDKPKNKLQKFWQQIISNAYYDDGPHEKGKEEARNKVVHIIALSIHTLVCLLIYLAFGRTDMAYLAALIFSIHPFNHEVSIWLSGKWYAITTVAVLFSWIVPFIAPFIYGYQRFAFTMIPAPLMFLTMPRWWKLLALLSPIILAVYYQNIFTDCGGLNSKMAAYCYHKEALARSFRKVIIWFKFYGYYFTCCLLAHKIAMFHKYQGNYLVTQKATDEAYKPDRYLFIGIGVLFVLITNLVLNYQGLYSQVWGLLWFTVMIAPFCNFVSVGNMLVASRYAYMANIGICLLLAHWIIAFPWLALVLGWYLARTFQLMKGYKNDYWHTEFQVFEEPNHDLSWILHGNMMFSRGHIGAALQDYFEARNKYPESFKANFNISSCFIVEYNIPFAIKYFEEAKLGDLLGQEQTKENIVKEREKLIGDMYAAQKMGKPLKINYEEIPMMI